MRMSEEIIYWCLRKLDPYSPHIASIKNVVRDKKGHLYSILFNKKTPIIPREYRRVKEKHPLIKVYTYQYKLMDDEKNGTMIAEMVEVVTKTQKELNQLNSESKKAFYRMKRNNNKANSKEILLTKLKNAGIYNSVDLLLKGPFFFEKEFKRKELSDILWKPAYVDSNCHIKRQDLYDLAIEYQRNLTEDTKKYILNFPWLDGAIHDSESLFAFGFSNFVTTIGYTIINIINNSTGRPNEKDFIQFAENLWWGLDQLIISWLSTKGVSWWLSLQRKSETELRGMGRPIWLFLNQNVKNITTKEKNLISEKLWYDPAKEISDAISTAIAHQKKKNTYEAIHELQLWVNTTPMIYHFLPEIINCLGYDPIEAICHEIREEIQSKWNVHNAASYHENFRYDNSRFLQRSVINLLQWFPVEKKSEIKRILGKKLWILK